MKEENKPKLLFWLCAIQFVLSVSVMSLNIPASAFVAFHRGPDNHIRGMLTQLREVHGNGFTIHMWATGIAIASGVVGVLVFLALFGTVCRMGWTQLIRKIRNPSSLTQKEFDLMRHVPARMVFLHPRVIIGAGLWTNLFLSATACVTVYVSYAISDHLDVSETGRRFLGQFDIETYLCDLLPWATQGEPDKAYMTTQQHCMLAKSARWLMFLSTIFSFFQFFICVWVLDCISRPMSVGPEKRKARQVQSQRGKSQTDYGRASAVEAPAVIDRVAGRF